MLAAAVVIIINTLIRSLPALVRCLGFVLRALKGLHRQMMWADLYFCKISHCCVENDAQGFSFLGVEVTRLPTLKT